MNKLAVRAATKVGKNIAGDTVENFKKNFDSEDPFYYIESRPTEGGMSEKKKKEKRKFKNYKNGLMGSKIYHAPGVPDDDNLILASVRRRAWHLDMSLFHWCGFRFGWSVIIGLIPVLGDVIDCLLAWWIIRKAQTISGGLPSEITNKMYLNVLADFLIGLVPLLGDIADALYKANSRNTWLLEDYLVKRAANGLNPPHSGEPGDLEQGHSAQGHSAPGRSAAPPSSSSAPKQPKPTKKMKGTRR